MDDERKVPMLARGEIRWIPESQVKDQEAKGWVRWTMQEAPKESYYPQYDQPQDKLLIDERINVLGSDDEIKSKLGVILV